MIGGGEILFFISANVSGGIKNHNIIKSTTHFSRATSGAILGIYRGNTSSLVSITEITQ